MAEWADDSFHAKVGCFLSKDDVKKVKKAISIPNKISLIIKLVLKKMTQLAAKVIISQQPKT
jgi:hypothetical protein